jgi:hypothetical protein
LTITITEGSTITSVTTVEDRDHSDCTRSKNNNHCPR